MNERDFVYWLQGFLELTETKTLNTRQTQIIKDHLNLVFLKMTPVYPEPSPVPYFGPDSAFPTETGTEIRVPRSDWIPVTCSYTSFPLETTTKKPPIGFKIR